MTEHLSTSRIKRFCVRALPVGDLTTIAEHLADCPTCHQQFIETLRSRRGSAPLQFTLAPEFWFRHEHLDYERLVELADNTLDATEREIVDIHLKVCASCREDVRGFLAFREQMAQEREVSYASVAQEPAREKLGWLTWWRGLAWKPIYATAVLAIGIALVIGAAFFLKRRADNFQAKQTPTPNVNLGAPAQTPTPDNRAANGPSPPATPNESPVEKPNRSAAIIALNDRAGLVTVDKDGSVSGLDDVPAAMRDEIAKALVAERIQRPSILKDLAGEKSTLRGSNSAQPFKLISPVRTVIVSDRPAFKWEKLSGASTYRVYVNDLSGHEAARSEELPSDRTAWIVPKPLKRAEIYSWIVMAVVDGKEIVSPGPSSPEMKFQILSTSNMQKLNQLRRTRSHLALGVFSAKVGLLTEAIQEFQELVRLNPTSRVARDLLRITFDLRH